MNHHATGVAHRTPNMATGASGRSYRLIPRMNMALLAMFFLLDGMCHGRPTSKCSGRTGVHPAEITLAS